MIITISRLVGAGGQVVGTELSRRLGIRLVDSDVRPLVAAELGTTDDVVTTLDERVEPAGVRLLRSLGLTVAPETGATIDTMDEINADDVERATRAVLQRLAAEGSMIVIGRGARWILGRRPDSLDVRLVAPLTVRIERFREREGIDARTAEHTVQATDRARAAHVQRYYHVDWNDPENYHLVLNTGALSMNAAVDLIVAATSKLD